MYDYYKRPQRIKKRHTFRNTLIVIVVVAVGFAGFWFLRPDPVQQAIEKLQFDSSVSENEVNLIKQKVTKQAVTYNGVISVNVKTATTSTQPASVLAVYVPVTNVYSPRQKVTLTELTATPPLIVDTTDQTTRQAIATLLGITPDSLQTMPASSVADVSPDQVVLVPAQDLTSAIKLLYLDNTYYLDSFSSGAVFREAIFTGEDTAAMANLVLNQQLNKEQVFKMHITGVTALTRVMMRKLNQVQDPLYFSEFIGDYLADADITHVSNEVSFKPDCQYNNALFCSPPEMIEVLKDSGVDIVELTGNHNNDLGSQYNTDTINLYSSLGWSVVGGGLNTSEARKPYVMNQKQSTVTLLAYNYPDSPNGNAIAGQTTAGANAFDFSFAAIEQDIQAAKQQSNFVIVNVQFWECYAYPDGYVEFPQCDLPIPNQKEVFRQLVDLGADMVVGTSAHQPQTYELYNGKPIYYGLGNLYFEQTSWPGTERGIILAHYFYQGKLLQTKLAPTVYDSALQTRLMTDEEAAFLLKRLNTARDTAGL